MTFTVAESEFGWEQSVEMSGYWTPNTDSINLSTIRQGKTSATNPGGVGVASPQIYEKMYYVGRELCLLSTGEVIYKAVDNQTHSISYYYF